MGRGEGGWEEPSGAVVQWASTGLGWGIGLAQPRALNLRQRKGGGKLGSCLAEAPQGLTVLLREGALGLLLELLHRDHISSTLKLSILRALDALTSAPAGVEAFLHSEGTQRSGYQVRGSDKLQNLILSTKTIGFSFWILVVMGCFAPGSVWFSCSCARRQ